MSSLHQFRGCRQPLPWRTGSTLQVLRLLPEPQGIKPIVTRQPTTTNTKQPISLTSKHRHLQRTPSEITKSNRRAPSSLTDFTPKHAQIKPPRSNLQTRSPISPEPRTNRTPVHPPISPMDFTRATHGSNPLQHQPAGIMEEQDLNYVENKFIIMTQHQTRLGSSVRPIISETKSSLLSLVN